MHSWSESQHKSFNSMVAILKVIVSQFITMCKQGGGFMLSTLWFVFITIVTKSIIRSIIKYFQCIITPIIGRNSITAKNMSIIHKTLLGGQQNQHFLWDGRFRSTINRRGSTCVMSSCIPPFVTVSNCLPFTPK